MTTENNNLEKKFDLDMILDRINVWLKVIVVPLNYINTLAGFIMGVLHVYIPLPSIPGLIFGILSAASGSASQAISYGFTHNNAKSTQKIASEEMNTESESPKPQLKHTFKSNLFLGFAIPCIGFLTSGAFFGMYTGTMMLCAVLSVPFPPAIILAVALTLGAVLAGGTLINSWLQTHNAWVRIRKNETEKLTTANNENLSPQTTSQTNPHRRLSAPTLTPQPVPAVDLISSSDQEKTSGQKTQATIPHTLTHNPASIFAGLLIKDQLPNINPVSKTQPTSKI